jgi:hypothetical protein
MALPKDVRVGGAYYKGYKLTVLAPVGDYQLDMTLASKSCAVNGITVVPDVYGAGDYFKLEHLNSDDVVQALLAETVYNIGAHIAWLFDFPAYELMDAGDKFRLTYTNVAGKAMSVYTNLERLTTKSGGA